jgi:hypothetical protein
MPLAAVGSIVGGLSAAAGTAYSIYAAEDGGGGRAGGYGGYYRPQTEEERKLMELQINAAIAASDREATALEQQANADYRVATTFQSLAWAGGGALLLAGIWIFLVKPRLKSK